MDKPQVNIAVLVLAETRVHFMKEDGRSLFQPDSNRYELVVCLDMDEFSSVDEVKRTLESLEHQEVMVIAALGSKIHDMVALLPLVDGITQRPQGDTFEDWRKRVEPFVIAKLFPDYEDELDLD